jgi:hypothetical protein
MLDAITKRTAIIIECDELIIEFLLLLTENLVYSIVYMDFCIYDNLEGCTITVLKTTNKESILLLEKEYTMKSALDFIESWIKISSYTYRHEETSCCTSRHR